MPGSKRKPTTSASEVSTSEYRLRYREAIRSLCEDEEHLLTFYAFPPVIHRYIRSTNAIESLFSNVRVIFARLCCMFLFRQILWAEGCQPRIFACLFTAHLSTIIRTVASET
jgi:hypothetical protein